MLHSYISYSKTQKKNRAPAFLVLVWFSETVSLSRGNNCGKKVNATGILKSHGYDNGRVGPALQAYIICNLKQHQSAE